MISIINIVFGVHRKIWLCHLGNGLIPIHLTLFTSIKIIIYCSISRKFLRFWLEYVMKGPLTVTSNTMIFLTFWLFYYFVKVTKSQVKWNYFFWLSCWRFFSRWRSLFDFCFVGTSFLLVFVDYSFLGFWWFLLSLVGLLKQRQIPSVSPNCWKETRFKFKRWLSFSEIC